VSTLSALPSPAQAVAAQAAPSATPGQVSGALGKIPPTVLNGESIGRLIKSTQVPISADLRSHGVGTSFNTAA
jgi:hypothetical protein